MLKYNENRDWQYLGFDTFSAKRNMKIDRQLFTSVQSAEIKSPVLRFYRWEKPAISLGLNQKAEDVINVQQIKKLNYDIVQRPTGGHALLHKGDLCYAVISNRLWHTNFKSLSSSYRAIASVIYKLLDYMGVSDKENSKSVNSIKNHQIPCFAMRSPFEVSISERKISGSSQYRSGDCFLQHGSIRVLDNWTVSDLQSIWPEGFNISVDNITSIEKELRKKIEFELVVEKFLQAFSNFLQIEISV